MKEVSIFGDNRIEPYLHTRIGCRGIVVMEEILLQEEKRLHEEKLLLLSHETKSGWWLIPGGGLEGRESLRECCAREVEEETGYLVRPEHHFLTLNEYYGDYRFISHYWICTPVGMGEMHLTEPEKARGLEPAWLPLSEALRMFSRHQEYAAVSEEKRGSYQREFTALTEYCQFMHQS